MHKTVHMLGELSQFGSEWTVSDSKVSDIFKLIDCQIPTFRGYLIAAAEAGLDIAIVSAKGLSINSPLEVFMDNAVKDDIYVSLIPAGSGKGWGKILAAIVIAVVSFYTFGVGAPFANATVASVGYSIAVSLALQGITQLLTKAPKTDKEEEGPGIFDGPENTVTAGQPVPVLYGELLVGGAPIHVDIGFPTSAPFGLPFNFPGSIVPSSFGISPILIIMSGDATGSGDEEPIVINEDLAQILENIQQNFGIDPGIGSLGSIM